MTFIQHRFDSVYACFWKRKISWTLRQHCRWVSRWLTINDSNWTSCYMSRSCRTRTLDNLSHFHLRTPGRPMVLVYWLLLRLVSFFCCVIYESNTAELGSVFGMAQKLGLVTIKTIIMVNFPEIVDQLIQHITPILKSLHWLKVSERIEYKIFSLTYKILSTTQPLYLYDLISIQPPHGYNTRSSSYVTLIKPSSSLRVTQRSFRHASPHLWNQLPTSLRIPHPNYSSPLSDSFEHASLSWYTLLSPSITFSLFHSELKTYLFLKSYPLPYSVSVCRTDLMALDCSPDLFAHRFYILVLFFCFSYF